MTPNAGIKLVLKSANKPYPILTNYLLFYLMLPLHNLMNLSGASLLFRTSSNWFITIKKQCSSIGYDFNLAQFNLLIYINFLFHSISYNSWLLLSKLQENTIPNL